MALAPAIRRLKRWAKPPIITVLHHCGTYTWRLHRSPPAGGWAFILTYHRVNGHRPHERRTDTAFEKGIDERRFDRHMRFVRERLRPTSLLEIVETLQRGQELPPRATAVTFDDGYEDTYTVAYPVLQRYRIPATVFVITDLIGTSRLAWWDLLSELIKRTERPSLNPAMLHPRPPGAVISVNGRYPLTSWKEREAAIDRLSAWGRALSAQEIPRFLTTLEEQCGVSRGDIPPRRRMLTWDQVRAMSPDLVSIQSHTHSHANLGRAGEKQAREELATSKAIIEASIRQPVSGFAYPYGQPYPDTVALSALAKDLGYTHACVGGDLPAHRGIHPYSLSRLGVPNVPLPILLREMAVGLRELR